MLTQTHTETLHYISIKLPLDIGSGGSGKSSNTGIGPDVSTATKTENILDLSRLKPVTPIGSKKNCDSSEPSVYKNTEKYYTDMFSIVLTWWLTSETNSSIPLGFLRIPRKLKGLSADWNITTGGSPGNSGGNSEAKNKVVCPANKEVQVVFTLLICLVQLTRGQFIEGVICKNFSFLVDSDEATIIPEYLGDQIIPEHLVKVIVHRILLIYR